MGRRIAIASAVALLILAAGTIALPTAYFLAGPSTGSFFSMLVADTDVSVERGLSYGNHERHKLDVYSPGQSAAGGPIAIFVYGGGWRSGHRATYGFVGAALAARGITTVIPDYRLYPDVKFPAFVEDAARAYRWVQQTLAGRDDGAARPVILIGHSAGAHIAALLAVDRAYLNAAGAALPPPAGLIGLAGPYAFDPTTYKTTRAIFSTASNAARARPAEQVTGAAPPALLIHGLEDETVKVWNTRKFAQALGEAGVKVRKLEFPGIGHVDTLLALSAPFRWRAPVLEETVQFILSLRRPG
ncbi:MAG: alpha/beta hydrolase [Hyphomicrobiales bacterium]